MLSKPNPIYIFAVIFIASLTLSGCASTKTEIHNPTSPPSYQPVRVSNDNADAAEPAIAAAPDGAVYVAWVNHNEKTQSDLFVARFNAEGQSQGPAIRVNSDPGVATAWRGDPPTIAVAPDRTVYIGWTARVESKSGHASTIYVSASRDEGKTFAAPVKVNDDVKPAVHGMHSLAVGADGRIYVAWLDERNVNPMPMKDTKMQAKSGGSHMESNREVFVSSSTDGGRTFSANHSVAKDACPCCKTALAVGSDGRAYLSWRQVLPGDFRHIAVSASADGGKSFDTPVIVSDDQWVLKGCPVSGAGLMAGNGRLGVVWYAGHEDTQQGLYWSESEDGGKTFRPRTLVQAGFAHGSPVLVSDGKDHSWTIWEATAKDSTEIRSASVGGNKGPTETSSLASAGELPAAIAQPDRILVAYVLKEGDKRSIWLKVNRI